MQISTLELLSPLSRSSMDSEENIKTREIGKSSNTAKRFLKILWLIPILTVGYIGWTNLMPLGATVDYFIDIGSKDTQGSAKITGPFDRISGGKCADNITFRELKRDLVYFELNDRRLILVSDVSVAVRFKDNFPKGTRFRLGARNKQEWSYDWKDAYTEGMVGSQQAETNGWLTAEVAWRAKELYISNNSLTFCLSAPHLTKEPDRTIPVDWVEIKLKIPPLYKRLAR